MEDSVGRLGIGMMTFGLSEALNVVVWKTYYRCQRCHFKTKA